MRIDLNTQATNGVDSRVGSSSTPVAAKPADSSGRTDTTQFLFDRVKTQALAPETAHQIEARNLKLEALRKALSEGSYDVPPTYVAGAILAEARI